MAELLLSVLCLLVSVSPARLTSDPLLVPGDVQVDAVFAMYEQDTGQCGSILPMSVQQVEAAKWVFSRLNQNNYIPDVSIGMRIHPTCRSPEEAKNLAFDIAQDISNGSYSAIGVLGPTYSSEAQAMSRILGNLPGNIRLPQVGSSTTARTLSDRAVYSNVFRTISSDTMKIKVLRKLMENLNWTYVAILHDGDAFGTEGAKLLTEESIPDGICYPLVTSVDPSLSEADTVNITRHFLDTMATREVPVGGVIAFGDDKLVKSLLLAAAELKSERGAAYQIPSLLLPEAVSFILNDVTHSMTARGALTAMPTKRNIEDFENYWRNIFMSQQRLQEEAVTNPWLEQLYYSHEQCNLKANDSCPMFTVSEVDAIFPQSIYTEYTVEAAIILAKTTQELHSRHCGGSSGLCDALVKLPREDFIHELEKLKFDFDSTDLRFVSLSDIEIEFRGTADPSFPEGVAEYTVYNLQVCPADISVYCFENVGKFYSGTDELELEDEAIRDYDESGNAGMIPDLRKPQCPDNEVCSECHVTKGSPVLVEEGDLYIVGVVPIHDLTSSPLQCGKAKSGGLDTAESFNFSVQEAKSNFQGKIPNARIGVILIDSCNDAQVVQERVLSLHRHGIEIGGRSESVSDKIIGYVGAWVSDSSIALAEVLTRLGHVQISYASTSPQLSDRTLYPYFMRVTSSDVKQAEKMLEIVTQLNWNNVQIVHSETAYGIGGKNALVEHAPKLKICVSQTISVPQESGTSYSAIKDRILEKGDAKTVLLFLSSFDVERLLPIIDSLWDFVFVGSEGWGSRNVIGPYRNLAGTVTVANELPQSDKFKQHMKTLTLDKNMPNIWAREYIQEYFSCYDEWSFDKTVYGSPCGRNLQLDAYSGYRIETWVPFIQLAVDSLLIGAKTALDDFCDGDSSKLCPEFKSRPADLVSRVKTVNLGIGGGVPEAIYDTNGDGLSRFKVYVITCEGNQSCQYAQYFANEWTLRSKKTFNSTCNGSPECLKCFPPPPSGPAEAQQDTSKVGLQASLAVFVVLFVGALVAIVLLIRFQPKLCFKQKYEDPYGTVAMPKADADYLTAIADTAVNTPQFGDDSGGSIGRYTESPHSSLGRMESQLSFTPESSDSAIGNSQQNIF